MIAMDVTSPQRANVDVCRTEFGAGSAAGRDVLLPADRVLVQGWAYDPRSGPAEVIALAGDRQIPIPYGFERLDVVGLRGLVAVRSGFEARIEDLGATCGPVDLRIIARFGSGPFYQIGPAHRFLGVSPTLPEVPAASGARATGRIRRLVDTRPEPFPLGWRSQRSIRRGAAIEIAGWGLDPFGRPADAIAVEISGRHHRTAFTARPIADGEATAVAGAREWFAAGFHCLVDAEPFPPGVYDATVLVRADDGTWQRGPSTAFQIAPEVAEIAPIFLPEAREAASAFLERLAPLDPLRGEPIVVEGWSTDPATGSGGPVFVAFDDLHPLPIPSCIARRDLQRNGDDAIGFGGIADTADLRPGEHRLRVLMLSAYGAFWHVLAERAVRVRAT
jgi:hypothetical protein